MIAAAGNVFQITNQDDLTGFTSSLVQVGDVLLIQAEDVANAGNAGAFLITEVNGSDNPPTLTVLRQDNPDNAAPFAVAEQDIRFKVIRKATLDLVEPKDTLIPDANSAELAIRSANTLSTGLNSSSVQVFTSAGAALDLLKQGVKAGDTLKITTGSDKGTYTILNNPGPPGNSQLTLSSTLNGGENGITYSIYRAGTGGVERPLLRVSSVDLLEASGASLGVTVP